MLQDITYYFDSEHLTYLIEEIEKIEPQKLLKPDLKLIQHLMKANFKSQVIDQEPDIANIAAQKQCDFFWNIVMS